MYTLTPNDLRTLASEFKDDLDSIYTALYDPDPEGPPLSLGDVKDLERRREYLLHQRGYALAIARTIGLLNRMSEDQDSTGLLRELLDEAANQWPSKRNSR